MGVGIEEVGSLPPQGFFIRKGVGGLPSIRISGEDAIRPSKFPLKAEHTHP